MKRFWAKVDQQGPDECWPWTACRKATGYGMFSAGRGSPSQAHRVAYELTHGPIAEGLVVRHRCDNPGCCNPAHLETGTVADNNRDTVERGRSVHAHLTEAQVVEIRETFAAGGVSQAALAREFSVSPMMISKIIRRKKWTHV